MAATYFTQFPQEIEEQNEIIDTQRQEREQEVKVYVHSVTKQELRDHLLAYILKEMGDRDHL